MKVWNFLKKYGAIIGTFLAGIFIAIFAIKSSDRRKDKRAIKKDIKKTEKEISEVELEIGKVEAEKANTKEDIKKTDAEIKDLKGDLGKVDNKNSDIISATDLLKDFAKRNKNN